MKSANFLLVTISAVIIAANQNCDKNGILLYEDLGCTPTHTENKCPDKFTCEHLGPSNTHCYHKGETYTPGGYVNDSLSLLACEVACTCTIEDQVKGFVCAEMDCGETLKPTDPENCYTVYSLEYCCPYGKKCPSSNDVQKCIVDGEEYKEGEKFWPSNTCLVCVCQKGFEGKFEAPFCRRRHCGEQFSLGSYAAIEQKCAPFYTKADVLCCPEGWVCPDGAENIKGEAKTDDFCQYGNKTLKVGQYFDRSNYTAYFEKKSIQVHCECVIPPLVTCKSV